MSKNPVILFVYEMHPENVFFFRATDPDVVTVLKASHGKYVNGPSWPEENAFLDLLFDDDGNSVVDNHMERIDSSQPFTADFDMVVHAGFVL